ncbi:hypothetical protein G9F31_09440 [Acinetobacter sp. 187]|uniref:hypothetical protein n=1 Tax=Acinetobacter lanii TaxID=2715163 RepID=UPI00140A6363|nr:hypothetical protein [Acinetobacter lanii]NHC03992.1 hypothetical protein [Acinetobacter lanii]
MQMDSLAKASLSQIREVFKNLDPVSEELRQGFFRASFIGPWWLRVSAMPSIALSGLGGWQGKKFLDPFHATNIIHNKQGVSEKLHMRCSAVTSLIDGKRSVALQYRDDAVVPWRWVIDEMRTLDQNTFLCMTVINLPVLKHFSFPFILSRES